MQVEMAILWDNHTWTDCHFVDIPDDVDPDEAAVEAAGRENLKCDGGMVASVLYHYSPDDQENGK
jgi:hypothetical protein